MLSLERGRHRATTPDFEHNHDELRYSSRTELMIPLERETWTWRPNPRARSLPMRQYGSFHPGEGTGGAGVHWAAQTWRFYPSDMQYRTHHVERYGVESLPEGSRIQDWPITYDELEPYYDRFEYDIGVSGQAGNLGGTVIGGGNPYEGARSRPYPLPPLVRSLGAERFHQACDDLGHHVFPQPASILSEAYTDLSGRTRSGCLYCGFCTRYGCEVDAKASAVVSHIPMALETGRYSIRYGCTVVSIDTDDRGRATGVTYMDEHGREHVQPAETVIVSAFAINNVRLLLLSRGGAHPDGVGNDEGLVGKSYTYQLVRGPVSGLFEGERFNQFTGNSCLQDVIHDFNADNFDHGGLGFIGGASITCGGGERTPIGSAGGLPVGDGPRWGSAWKEELRKWDSVLGISIQGESLPYDDQFVDLDPTYTDVYGLPLARITYDFHRNDYLLYRYVAARCEEIMRAMGPTRMASAPELAPYSIAPYQSTHTTGGAIMGTGPDDSVTNRYGQVWDTPNVFVTGATLYPQNPGMNPTGPLCALAYLTTDALVDRYAANPGELLA